MSKVTSCKLAKVPDFHLFVPRGHNLGLAWVLLLQVAVTPPCNQFFLPDFRPRLLISFVVISDTSLALF